jgi:hypothetical protein
VALSLAAENAALMLLTMSSIESAERRDGADSEAITSRAA